MKINLSVGTVGALPYARECLRQCGIGFVELESIQQGLQEGIRVFIDGDPDTTTRYADLDHVAILTTHRKLARQLDSASRPVDSLFYNYSNPVSGEDFSFFAKTQVFTLAGATQGHAVSADGQPIEGSGILTKKIDRNAICSVPFDVFSKPVGSSGWEYRPYYSRTAGKFFCEVGPMIDYGGMRNLIVRLLAKLYEEIELPMVRVSPRLVSGPKFSFRIDADGFSEESTIKTLELFGKHKMRATWFIDVLGWEKELAWINRLVSAGQDVQLHCYRHVTYKAFRTNLVNIRRGISLLSRAGVTPRAIVSPFGFYYGGFQRCVTQLGFDYSSEFGYATDDLPSFMGKAGAMPLQIPAHPGSIGVFREAGFTNPEMFGHLLETVQMHASQDGMAVIYDHPLGRMEKHIDEFDTLFSKLHTEGITHMPLQEYGELWRSRRIGSAYYDSSKGAIELSCSAELFKLDVYDATRAELNINGHKTAASGAMLPYQNHGYETPGHNVIGLCRQRTSRITGEVDDGVVSWSARTAGSRLKRFLR